MSKSPETGSIPVRSRHTVEAVVTSLQLIVLPFDLDQAVAAAQLRLNTRDAGLSLGDRACLAAAKLNDASALTADRA